MSPTTQQSAAHTAGPWRTNGSQVIARGDWKAPVCVVLSKEDVRPTPDAAAKTLVEAQANARLIAAAPELLAVALAAVDWAKDAPTSYRDWPFVVAARSAIACATLSHPSN